MFVEHFRIGAARGFVHRHAQPFGNLGVGRAEQRHFGGAVAVHRGAHIHIGHQAADNHRRARFAQLAEDDAQKRFGQRLDGSSGQCGGGGSASQGAGGVDEGDFIIRGEDQLLDNFFGMTQRRYWLDVERE